jgi:hypothetical protein
MAVVASAFHFVAGVPELLASGREQVEFAAAAPRDDRVARRAIAGGDFFFDVTAE